MADLRTVPPEAEMIGGFPGGGGKVSSGRGGLRRQSHVRAPVAWGMSAPGPVAQLAEQRVYTASVVGSSPAGSTKA